MCIWNWHFQPKGIIIVHKIFQIFIQYWITRLSFPVRLSAKNQNPHFRNIKKKVSSVFSMYHFKRTNRKIWKILCCGRQDGLPCLPKRRGDHERVHCDYFLKGGSILSKFRLKNTFGKPWKHDNSYSILNISKKGPQDVW